MIIGNRVARVGKMLLFNRLIPTMTHYMGELGPRFPSLFSIEFLCCRSVSQEMMEM